MHAWRTDVLPEQKDTAPRDVAEGTIRFAYGLEPPEGPVAPAPVLQALRGWRSVLRRLGLVGQTPERYGGLGFGNLSGRDTGDPQQFVITASQTAGAPELEEGDLVRILHSSTSRFWVDALGHQPPSSETLTHAMIYEADPAIGWVLHGHSPDIWQRADELDLPATPESVAYGSADMVSAVAALLESHPERPLVFVTLGHEDGVFACGRTAAEAGGALAATLARALS